MSLDQNIRAGFTAVGTKVKEINNSLINLDSSVVKKINGISPVQGNVNIETSSGIHIGASEPEGNESVWIDTDESTPRSFTLGSIKDGQELTLRKGTTSDHSTFIGAVGEITYNTTEGRIVTHDGSTIGGIPMAKKSEIDAIDVGVTSFNGSKGAVTYSAPVTSVNGKTGAVTIDTGVTSVNGNSGALTPAQTGCVPLSGGTMTGRLTVKYGYRGITQQFASGETFSDYAFLDESGDLIGNIRTTKASSGVRSVSISANGKDANGSVVWKSLTIGAGSDGSGAFCAFDNQNILTVATGAVKDHTHESFTVSSGRPVTTFQSGATASSIAFKDSSGTFKGEIGIGASGVPIFINSSYSVNNIVHAGNISTYAVIPSGSRGTLAGYNTPASSSSAITISNTSNDDTIVTAAVAVTVNNGSSGQTWTKTIALQNASATVTLGSSWKWVGGSAPTISANSILVVKWCGTFGLANLIAGA